MFSNPIYETSLTSEAANRLFSNLDAISSMDASFISTLRVLLHKRLPQDEYVHLNCRNLHYSAQDISVASIASCMNNFAPNSILQTTSKGHGITIVYTTSPDAGERMLEIVKAHAGIGKRYMSNYKRCDDLQVFYARTFKALFYTDDTERNTVIFAEKLELKHFHIMQMTIPRYLPLLFDDSPLTDDEVKLLTSTGSKKSDDYMSCIESFAKEIDMRSEIIRCKLAGFETGFERMRADELRNEIDIYQGEYDMYLSKMREAAEKIQTHKYTLAGLECAINKYSGDSELMEYFMCNKNLSIMNVAGLTITFVAHGYSDIYDEDAFDTYAENLDGYFYNGINPDIAVEQMENLYRAIFNEGKYKLRICAAYTVNMQTGLKAIKNYAFPHESKTYFPNPHIQQFGCIGSYAGRFQEYLAKRDYVGAIDQAVVSARNLNFYDSAPISRFAYEFSHTSIKCLEKPDGTLLTPIEAINELEGSTPCQDQ